MQRWQYKLGFVTGPVSTRLRQISLGYCDFLGEKIIQIELELRAHLPNGLVLTLGWGN